jgi:hypothetical protein
MLISKRGAFAVDLKNSQHMAWSTRPRDPASAESGGTCSTVLVRSRILFDVI